MSKQAKLKNALLVLLNDEQAGAFTMAADVMGMSHAALGRCAVTQFLINNSYLQNPMQKYIDRANEQKKAG